MYDIVYAATVGLSSVFILLNIASRFACTLAVFDIKGAFLNAQFGPNDPRTFIKIRKDMIHSVFVLQRAREFLGSSCDLQLRVLSRACSEFMQEIPLEESKPEDYLSFVALYEWATDHMRMPMPEGIYEHW
ncbi:hypothetical protein B484DRAFT_408323 [Ochromonadaceae sp. CCMP2298]|nr:hypothetical protein B484DRAFT_408323 [Ochromonadaceae sp. CCMP2298]